MKKVRLGLVGCGKMAINHAQSFESLKDIMELSCVCDIDKEAAEAMGKRVGTDKVFTDYRDMLPYVDAVLAVLPHEIHFEVGMFFIENKKHVLMEKPLCINEKECFDMVHAAEKHKVKLMTAYCVRYLDPVLKMKECVDNGLIGDVFHMSIWTEQRTLMKRCSIKDLGGGQLFSHGCHYIDILLWFLGKPVRGCHLGTNLGTPKMEREGTSDVVIEFESGALGYHMGTWGAVGTRHGWEFQIHGTKGMLAYSKGGEYGGKVVLYTNLGTQEQIHNEEENHTDIEILWSTDEPYGKKTAGEIRHFCECILDDKAPLTTGYDSIQGLRVIWKLYEAEEKGVIADLRGLGLGELCE